MVIGGHFEFDRVRIFKMNPQIIKTQATSSTSKLRVLPLEPAITTGCQLRSSDCHNENGGV